MTLIALAVKKYLTPLYDFLLVFDLNRTKPYGTTLLAQVHVKDTWCPVVIYLPAKQNIQLRDNITHDTYYQHKHIHYY